MSKKQLIQNMISDIPENKLDIVLSFLKLILQEESEINNSLLSEYTLSKTWLIKEEDAAWKYL